MAHSKKLPILLIFLAGGFHIARGDSADPVQARLRENLRNASLQLRSVSAERDTLQDQNTGLQGQLQDLTQKMAKLAAQAAADRAASATTIADLQARLTTQAQSIADYQKALAAGDAEQQRTTALLNTFQSRAAALTGENAALKQSVDQEKGRNAAMLNVAMEVLRRYEKQGIGQVLLDKEPFTGLARARLENIAQDYQTQLLAQRIRP